MGDRDDISTVRKINDLLMNLYKPSEADEWWSAPQEIFGRKSALDMVAKGKGEEVILSLRRLVFDRA